MAEIYWHRWERSDAERRFRFFRPTGEGYQVLHPPIAAHVQTSLFANKEAKFRNWVQGSTVRLQLYLPRVRSTTRSNSWQRCVTVLTGDVSIPLPSRLASARLVAAAVGPRRRLVTYVGSHPSPPLLLGRRNVAVPSHLLTYSNVSKHEGQVFSRAPTHETFTALPSVGQMYTDALS